MSEETKETTKNRTSRSRKKTTKVEETKVEATETETKVDETKVEATETETKVEETETKVEEPKSSKTKKDDGYVAKFYKLMQNKSAGDAVRSMFKPEEANKILRGAFTVPEIVKRLNEMD